MSLEEDFFEVGLRIRALRGTLQQTEFADKLGVDRKSVSGWEAGKRLPDGKSLLALVREFGADVNYLLTGVKGAAEPALDSAERVLLDSYRRCNDDGRQTLIKTAALLSAGMATASTAGVTQTASSGGVNHTGTGDVHMGATEQPHTQHVRAKGAGAQAAGRNIINKGKK